MIAQANQALGILATLASVAFSLVSISDIAAPSRCLLL